MEKIIKSLSRNLNLAERTKELSACNNRTTAESIKVQKQLLSLSSAEHKSSKQ